MKVSRSIAVLTLGFLAAVPTLTATTTVASAQGWDRDWDRDRDRGGWRERDRDRGRDWDHDRGRRGGWRESGDCRFVQRRWVDDDGDVHIVRRRICD